MSILDRILAQKRIEVEEAKTSRPVEDFIAHIEAATNGSQERRSFRDALADPEGISLIAEVKKASPSKGIIRAPFDPVDLAQTYVASGARAVSVLTDTPFFQGSLADLMDVRAAIDAPILRKEFIIDPYQLYEAKWAGADAVLLIVAALSPDTLQELIRCSAELGLDVLVEVHTEAEVGQALDAGADTLGINNRNLKTFETTLDVTRRLLPSIPDSVTVVSESGIARREDVTFLEELGVDAILVGEALAKQEDVAAKVHSLIGVDAPPPHPPQSTGRRGTIR